MSRPPVRNVIFDFGGVLVRWQPQQIVAGFYADETLRSRLTQLVFRHPDWLEMDRGTLAEAQAVERFAARMQRPVEEMWALLAHVKESLTPMPESFAIVHDLARRGLSLYGLSNMSLATYEHLRQRYDVWHAFRGIVISAQVKLMKPDAAIFEYLARTHAVTPSESVFIDDSSHNIESAARLGYRTILFADPTSCAASLVTHLEGAP